MTNAVLGEFEDFFREASREAKLVLSSYRWDEDLIEELLQGFPEDETDEVSGFDPQNVMAFANAENVPSLNHTPIPQENVHQIPLPHSRTIHGKAFVLYDEGSLSLSVGSANLTSGSFQGSWECNVEFSETVPDDLGPGTEISDPVTVAQEAHEFFRRLGALDDESADDWTNLIRNFETSEFLTTITQPGLTDGLRRACREEGLDSLHFLYITPYFGISAIEAFAKRFDQLEQLTVLTNKPSTFSNAYRGISLPEWSQVEKRLGRLPAEVEILFTEGASIAEEFDITGSRQFIHSKVLFVSNEPLPEGEPQLALVTSANLTKQAWALDSRKQNVEYAVVLPGLEAKELCRKVFQRFLKHRISACEEAIWNTDFKTERDDSERPGIWRGELTTATGPSDPDSGGPSGGNGGADGSKRPSPEKMVQVSGIGESLSKCREFQIRASGLSIEDDLSVLLTSFDREEGKFDDQTLSLDPDTGRIEYRPPLNLLDCLQDLPTDIRIKGRTDLLPEYYTIDKTEADLEDYQITRFLASRSPRKANLLITDLEADTIHEIESEALFEGDLSWPDTFHIRFRENTPADRILAWAHLPRQIASKPWEFDVAEQEGARVRIELDIVEDIEFSPLLLDYDGAELRGFRRNADGYSLGVALTQERASISLPTPLPEYFDSCPPIRLETKKAEDPRYQDEFVVGPGEYIDLGETDDDRHMLRLRPGAVPRLKEVTGDQVRSGRVNDEMVIWLVEQEPDDEGLFRVQGCKRYRVRQRLSDTLTPSLLPEHLAAHSKKWMVAPLCFVGWTLHQDIPDLDIELKVDGSAIPIVHGRADGYNGIWVGVHSRIREILPEGPSSWDVQIQVQSPDRVPWQTEEELSISNTGDKLRLAWG